MSNHISIRRTIVLVLTTVIGFGLASAVTSMAQAEGRAVHAGSDALPEVAHQMTPMVFDSSKGAVHAPTPVITIYRVAKTGDGSNGLNWTTAFTNVQDALVAAAAGGDIWVATGVYTPGANRSDSFSLASGMALYGGFDTDDTQLSDRDWEINVTVLSGDIDNNDTNNDSNNISETPSDIQGANSYHVVTGSNRALLDGFTITAGQANGSSNNDRGGGMFNFNKSPTVTQVTFSGNTADWGGGMYNYNKDPTMTEVTFSGNSADYGGGIYNAHCSPTLIEVTFSGNTTTDSGGGMANYYSSPALTNVTFSGNSAEWGGGGMYNYIDSSPTLTNVTFSGNSSVTYFGGGMYNWSGSPELTNVTFSGNSASNGGGGIHNYYSSMTLTNAILWGNSAGTSGDQIYNNNSDTTISYSLIQDSGGTGGTWDTSLGDDGGGNLDANPLFYTPIDPSTAPTTTGNLRLQTGSPAIDAGNNSAVSSGVTTDLDGNPRFVDIPTVPDTGSGAPPIVDMGAYEVPIYYLYLPLTNR